MAKKDIEIDELKEENFLLEFAKTALYALIFAVILSSFVKPTLVVGDSMYPTFKNTDYLVVNRVAYSNSIPKHGDIVVFKSHLADAKILIKRVIGEEGDKITIKDGKVFVNDKIQTEKYINEPETVGDVNVIVPKGEVFVMGDNRNHSLDSRFEAVGFIDKNVIIGKIFFKLLPFSGFGKI